MNVSFATGARHQYTVVDRNTCTSTDVIGTAISDECVVSCSAIVDIIAAATDESVVAVAAVKNDRARYPLPVAAAFS